MKPETQTNLEALRHAVMVGAQLLDEDMASELCDRIEAVVKAFDQVETLQGLLDADEIWGDFTEWADGIIMRDDTAGVVLSLPSLHDAIPFPQITGSDQPPADRPMVGSLLAQRWFRSLDRNFKEGSQDSEDELAAAAEALASVRPVSLFDAPILDARSKAHHRLELYRKDRQQEMIDLIHAQVDDE